MGYFPPQKKNQSTTDGGFPRVVIYNDINSKQREDTGNNTNNNTNNNNIENYSTNEYLNSSAG